MEGLSAPGTIKGRVQRAALLVIQEHAAKGELPTSIRFVYYEMKQRGLDLGWDADGRNTKGNIPGRPDENVINAITHLREIGLVPWSWIVDETRTVDESGYAATILEGVQASLGLFRIDAWGGNTPPLIICEARTLVGVLRQTADRYLCPITSTNGQALGHLHTKLVPRLDAGSPVIYLGDYNVAGNNIERHDRSVLEGELGSLDWLRLAVTPEQAEEHDLETKPDTTSSAGGVSYECEALGQGVLVDLLAATLDGLLPEPLADVLAREAEQREALRRRLA